MRFRTREKREKEEREKRKRGERRGERSYFNEDVIMNFKNNL